MDIYICINIFTLLTFKNGNLTYRQQDNFVWIASNYLHNLVCTIFPFLYYNNYNPVNIFTHNHALHQCQIVVHAYFVCSNSVKFRLFLIHVIRKVWGITLAYSEIYDASWGWGSLFTCPWSLFRGSWLNADKTSMSKWLDFERTFLIKELLIVTIYYWLLHTLHSCYNCSFQEGNLFIQLRRWQLIFCLNQFIARTKVFFGFFVSDTKSCQQ